MRRLALILCLWAAEGWAEAPQRSLRPTLRSVDTPVVQTASLRPVVRVQATQAVQPPPLQVALSVQAAAISLRPNLRPRGIVQQAMAKRREARRGAICGDIDIQGDVVGRVPGRIKGCGVQDAVRVRTVSGITLSQQSVMDCPTAKALKTWINNSAKPAFRSNGGGLSGLRVAAHYACRTRNNRPGAKISEHGKGRAIDISGFQMKDGSLISVLHGWNKRGSRRAMRAVHKGACGPFGTVLGPNADRFHRDHFHFDTARYRSGPYCR